MPSLKDFRSENAVFYRDDLFENRRELIKLTVGFKPISNLERRGRRGEKREILGAFIGWDFFYVASLHRWSLCR
jgi:hypothetical protein